jgi:hypothetical protein
MRDPRFVSEPAEPMPADTPEGNPIAMGRPEHGHDVALTRARLDRLIAVEAAAQRWADADRENTESVKCAPFDEEPT